MIGSSNQQILGKIFVCMLEEMILVKVTFESSLVWTEIAGNPLFGSFFLGNNDGVGPVVKSLSVVG